MDDEYHPRFELRVGDTIDNRFRVESLLGEGGMGQVVAVRHLSLGTLFAIKIMHPATLGNREAVQRFIQEARAIANLKHPNIVQVTDMGRTRDGAPFIVMEHLDGEDLRSLAKQRGMLPLHEVCRYMVQTCEGLSFAHARGIIHRDIKPANLLRTKDAKGEYCIKIVDFGIAKWLKTEGLDSSLITRPQVSIGTPLYMSPEQWRSAQNVTVTTDIWAVGVMLYHLTTNQTPWRADNTMDLPIEICGSDPIRPPSSHQPLLPPEFDAVVMRCLERNPHHRYPSVEALAEALQVFTTAPEPSRNLAHLLQTEKLPPVPHLRISDPGRTEVIFPPVNQVEPGSNGVGKTIEIETMPPHTVTGGGTIVLQPTKEQRNRNVLLLAGFALTLFAGLFIGAMVYARPEPVARAVASDFRFKVPDLEKLNPRPPGPTTPNPVPPGPVTTVVPSATAVAPAMPTGPKQGSTALLKSTPKSMLPGDRKTDRDGKKL